MKAEDIIVSISCITYNHAPYIRECLDGFMMQKTNFAFEVLIHDDASTDGTADIIREYEAKYPDVIKPIYEEENQWVKGRRGSAVFNFPRAKGKYIALCEGDDYWTDPLKLQKQVDILEANPEYVMCCHNFLEYPRNEFWSPTSTSGVITIDDFIKGNYSIRTLTVVFSKEKLSKTKYFKHNKKGDISLYYSLLSYGLGYYMQDVMAIYRRHLGGIWSLRTPRDKWLSSFDIHFDILRTDTSLNSAQYMYEFLLQKESRMVQLNRLKEIIKSLYFIRRYMGMHSVIDVLKLVMFRM